MQHAVWRGRRWIVIAILGGAIGGGSGPRAVNAQEGPVPMPPSESNPPSRAARIGYLEGAVSYRPAAGDTWALAEPNRALTTGDRLWVDSVGRAELEIGTVAVRASNETELDLVRVDDHAMQFRLPQGAAFLHIRNFDTGADYEVDAPNAAISLSAAGGYRVTVSPDGATTNVTVWSGQAEVTAGGQSFSVASGKTATITGDSVATYDVADAGPPDAFDTWAEARDTRLDRPSVSTQYVSPEMGGVADLDDGGTWAQDPDNGPVWYPNSVAVDWAPYRNGHWVWEGPWGWTWVEDEPWGWAPFHYGRWAYAHDRWGWCPGPRLYAPVYAPALVAFVGGGGWGVSIGFGAGGGVGWFPLAPREPFFPSYRTDIGYRERINVTNITNVTVVNNVTNINNYAYRNRSIANAVTAVPRAAFVDGSPVARAQVRVSSAEIERAPLAGRAAPFAPTSRSLAPSVVGPRGRPAGVPPARLADRAVVATHAPPPAAVRFSAQERALSTTGGAPLSPRQLATMRTSAPAATATGFPVRAATATAGRSLTPARTGIPAAAPSPSAGFARRTTSGFSQSPQTPAIAARVPEPSRAAAASPGAGATTRPAAGPTVLPSLQHSYQQQRGQMEARHQQEFATPAKTESMPHLQQRQEVEHQQLDRTYQHAQATHAPTMPPAPRPSAPAHAAAPAHHGKG